MSVTREINELRDDRDYWKAKAEALERAIKQLGKNLGSSAVYCRSCTGKDCDGCGYPNDFIGWQFDQARFEV